MPHLEMAASTGIKAFSSAGYPEPSITWHKDGRLLNFEGNPRLRTTSTGSLIIRDVEAGDGGRYKCIADNKRDRLVAEAG